MKVFHCILLVASLASVLCIQNAQTCDHLGVLLYEDLACTPHYNGSNACPTKFTCEGLEENNNTCNFKGRLYKDGEQIDKNLADPCEQTCFCSTKEDDNPKFTCAVMDCPEWLGVPVRSGCYRKYSLNQCCSVGRVCPPFDIEATCIVDGIVYKEGEQFYPKNTCKNCVCQKGFKGKLEEPFCRSFKCGTQLKGANKNLKRRCAPWYGNAKEALCCPNDWICPDGSEKIKGDVISDDVCLFGEKELKVGQMFERSTVKDNFGYTVDKVKCECLLPPLLTCTTLP